jgi:hypothetical protein
VRPFLAALLFCFAVAAPAQDRFFDSGGVRIRYVEAGKGAQFVVQNRGFLKAHPL